MRLGRMISGRKAAFLLLFATVIVAAQEAPPLTIHPIRGGVYWTEGGSGANTGFVVGKSGVIVIDAKTVPASASEMLAGIAKLAPQPVTHVVLTHSDGDHVNGLAAFPKGLSIIAQENCKTEMEASQSTPRPAPREYMPTQTFKDRDSSVIDGVKIELYHFAPAHTSGDTVVFLPEQKIVFTGDIIVAMAPYNYPVIQLRKHGSSLGWFETVKGMLALDADTYVPGHGSLKTKAELQTTLKDVEQRRAQIERMVKAGDSLDRIKAALGVTDLKWMPGFDT
jgi:cyclase